LVEPPFREIDDACVNPQLKKKHLNDERPYFQNAQNKYLYKQQKAYGKQSFKKEY